MDGARFDAWTRRRFNLAVGGGLATLLGLTTFETVLAGKKKKRKKKKKKKKPVCQALPAVFCDEQKPCCEDQGFLCLPSVEDPAGPSRCCRTGMASCQVDNDCCSGSCMNGLCTCKTNGQACGGFGSLCCSLKCGGDPNSTTCQPV